ncbi:MAG: hypothetical protein ABTD50_11465 [Polyangiaceae bacterium]
MPRSTTTYRTRPLGILREATDAVRVGLCAAAATVGAFAPDARAEPPASLATGGVQPRAVGEHSLPQLDSEAPRWTLPNPSGADIPESMTPPPPTGHVFLQFGVALAAEALIAPGDLCSGPSDQCVLGSGAGIIARAAFRASDQLFLGGAYEVSKHDAHELYRLATLQQIRVEGRRYFPTGRDVVPFLLLGAGVAAYGNELAIETLGPTATVGAGLEIQLGGPVLVCSIAYRPTLFQAWTDPSMPRHDAGVAHFLSVEIGLEAQDRM